LTTCSKSSLLISQILAYTNNQTVSYIIIILTQLLTKQNKSMTKEWSQKGKCTHSTTLTVQTKLQALSQTAWQLH